MSYEEISREQKPCPCGKGSVIDVLEMDDWNRVRHAKIFQCERCKAANNRRAKALAQKQRLAEARDRRAFARARKLHFSKWVDTFTGLSAKGCWRLLTKNGANYPSLGTFYKHVAHEGSLDRYLENYFDNNWKDIVADQGAKISRKLSKTS
jgi:hypothetical protein